VQVIEDLVLPFTVDVWTVIMPMVINYIVQENGKTNYIKYKKNVTSIRLGLHDIFSIFHSETV
jgi:hypothetical protein